MCVGGQRNYFEAQGDTPRLRPCQSQEGRFWGFDSLPRVPAQNKHDSPTQSLVRANFILERRNAITKRNRSLANQIFGIGQYIYRNGQLYFVHGKNRIKVTEHFPSAGKRMDLLLEDLIQFSAQQRKDEPHRTVQE